MILNISNTELQATQAVALLIRRLAPSENPQKFHYRKKGDKASPL